MISERVARLRQQSLDAKPTISPERAELMTQAYREQTGLLSAPMRRALAFQYLIEHRTITIEPDELIVGEKGPAPKATPTYPELCCHSLSRPRHPGCAREDSICGQRRNTRDLYRDTIIPFWQGHSMRELLFAEMTDEWKAAYEAGIFTEFMEQRAPGHTVLDDKIYRKGMLDFKRDIAQSLANLDYLNDPQAYAKEEELKAMSHLRRRADPLRRAPRRAGARTGAARTRSAAQAGTGAHRRGLHARARARAARFLGSAAVLLVRPSGRHHRAQYVGRLLPRPARPAPVSVLSSADWPTAR